MEHRMADLAINLDELPAVMTPAIVAEFLHTTTNTLSQDRYLGRGLPFVKFGNRVRYLRQDVLDYLSANRVQRTDDPRGVVARGVSPPGRTAAPGIGVTASPSMEDLKAFARMVFTNIGVDYGPNKINRLVTQFARAMPKANGWAFFLHLANEVQMTAEQRNAALLNPDTVSFLTYRDQVGELASDHVDLQRLGRRCGCAECVG
jgi:hypothetical protein